MKKSDSIQFKLYWTNQLDDSSKHDFIEVHRKVFNSSFDEETFIRKYFDNIYGDSIIVLSYIENQCIAARAFWRNDINGIKAFQPCDTAVLSEHRGKGLFKKMNLKALEAIDEDTLVYNFPNENSYSGYLKMGWKEKDKKRYKIFNWSKDPVDRIDRKYLAWLLGDKNNKSRTSLYRFSIKDKTYLLKKQRFNIYFVMGGIDKEDALNLNIPKFPICFNYSVKGYLGRGLVTVTRNGSNSIDIPVYKIDTLF